MLLISSLRILKATGRDVHVGRVICRNMGIFDKIGEATSGALNNMKNMNELRKIAEFLNSHVITENGEGVVCKFNGHGNSNSHVYITLFYYLPPRTSFVG